MVRKLAQQLGHPPGRREVPAEVRMRLQKGLRLLVKRPVSTGVTRKVRQIAAALICFCEVRNADETKNRLSTCPHFSGAVGRQLLSFLLMYVSPGDPVRAMYAVSGSIPSEEVLEQTREELGLNDPFSSSTATGSPTASGETSAHPTQRAKR
ncbi:MAG: hypothetical protein ACLRJV_18955 [Eubacteriales bacterium]